MMLFYPKPYSRETLLSFIYRVAKEHKMDNLDWIFDIIEKEMSIKLAPEKVNWLKGSELASVAKFLGIGFEEAEKLTVYNYFKRFNLEVNNESKNIWFLYKKTRFCPLCLKEGIYQRKSWINCHSIMCLEHQAMLIDSCNICLNIPNSKSIIQDECTNCNNKLSNSAVKQNFPSDFIEYQYILNQILDNNKLVFQHPWIVDPATYIKTLDFLALWIVKMVAQDNLSLIKYNFHFTGNILERNHLKNYRSIQQTICLYGYVFKIIRNWPIGFNEFLRIADERNDISYKSFIKHGLPRIINTELWDISKAFTNYITKEKSNLTGKQYIRSDEVKYLYPKFNGGIINSNQIEFNKMIFENIVLTVIDKDLLDTFMKEFNESYTKEEFRDLWGTSAKSTLAILKDGLIERAFCFKSGNANNWIIPKSSVSILEEKTKNLSLNNISNPITFNHAAEWIGPDKAHLLLRRMLSGSLKYECYTHKISDVVLDKRETYYQIKEEILKSSKVLKAISYRDLTFVLGVKRSDIQYWVTNGQFGKLENETNSHIPFQNFIAFHEKFITTLELAFKLNLQIKQVIKKNTIGKLVSVSGPQVDDGKRLLFSRHDF